MPLAIVVPRGITVAPELVVGTGVPLLPPDDDGRKTGRGLDPRVDVLVETVGVATGLAVGFSVGVADVCSG